MSPRAFSSLLIACVLLASMPRAGADDTRSGSWAATDALGRELPTFGQVGPPRPNRYVGIFYFLWLGEHGTGGPYDVTKILAREPNAINQPDNPLWGPLYAPHHWGESLFGYYLSDDEWVLRKHAQMLADAGVDTVIFDVTNGFTYKESYLALCRVWTQIRKEGGKTPQIAFLTPFWNPDRVVRTLYHDLYRPGLYPDLWFRWEGRPLILADPDLVGHSPRSEAYNSPSRLDADRTQGQVFIAERPFTSVGGYFPTWGAPNAGVTLTLRREGPGGAVLARRRFEKITDNALTSLELPRPLPAGTYYLEQSEPVGTVGWWSRGDDAAPGQAHADGAPAPGDRALSLVHDGDDIRQIRDLFTWRKPQASYFTGPTGPRQWAWLEVYPQHAFYVTPGVAEQVAVGVAQNAVDGKLGVLSNPRSHGRSFHDGRQPGPEGQDHSGRNFAEQFERALKLDPAFIFITGWNEWIAGRFPASAPFAGAGPVTFVDQFNHEYSRDIEPVKGGHTDSYYYQMVANIRRFKGVREPEYASPPKTLRTDGSFDDWKGVRPEFRDDAGDTAARSHRGWGGEGRYRNDTGRNDLMLLKVARDDDHLYFYARTRLPIVGHRDPRGMMLLLNTDGDARTGWQGYDFVVGRTAKEETTATLEAWAEGNWQPRGTVAYRVRGSEVELAVRRSDLRLTDLTKPLTLDFKWADNLQKEGDALDFYVSGDTAPNGRFRYRYRTQADR